MHDLGRTLLSNQWAYHPNECEQSITCRLYHFAQKKLSSTMGLNTKTSVHNIANRDSVSRSYMYMYGSFTGIGNVNYLQLLPWLWRVE